MRRFNQHECACLQRGLYASGACLARLGVPPALSVRYGRVNGFGTPTPLRAPIPLYLFTLVGILLLIPPLLLRFPPFGPLYDLTLCLFLCSSLLQYSCKHTVIDCLDGNAIYLGLRYFSRCTSSPYRQMMLCLPIRMWALSCNHDGLCNSLHKQEVLNRCFWLVFCRGRIKDLYKDKLLGQRCSGFVGM